MSSVIALLRRGAARTQVSRFSRIGSSPLALVAVAAAAAAAAIHEADGAAFAAKDLSALEAPKSKDGLYFNTLLRQRIVFLNGPITEDR